MADDFRQTMGIASPVWVDPQRRTYQLLGFKRSYASIVSPGALKNYARAFLRGHRQGLPQGDVLQQGGVVVVKRGGEPVYTYASEVSGDHPPIADVLSAAASAR